MYFLQIKIPEPFSSTFSIIRAMTMPLSMIIIGCNLAHSGIWKIIRDRKLYLATALRMIVLPAVICLVIRVLGVDPAIVRISTIIAALPSGSMTTIVASEYDCAPDYVANIMGPGHAVYGHRAARVGVYRGPVRARQRNRRSQNYGHHKYQHVSGPSPLGLCQD